MQRTFDISKPLKFNDGEYYVTEVLGGQYRLWNPSTDEYSMMAAWELPKRLAEPLTRLVANPRQLEIMPDDERENVTFWAEHIRELDTGCKWAGADFNPTYDPKTSLNDRISAKLRELESLGRATSRSTIIRKRKKLRAGGVTALIDGRELRTETPVDGADQRIVDALRKRAAIASKNSTITKLAHIAEAIAEVKTLDPSIEIPSEATLRRWFNYVSTGKRISKSSQSRKSLASVPKRSFGDTRKYFPGQFTEIDSTMLDCFVYDEDNNIGRPILTMLIDVCTRSIIAWTFRLIAAKAVDHSFLIAEALTPPQLRPNAGSAWQDLQLRFPWVDLVSVEDRAALDDTMPFIRPQTITIDWGTDYHGTAFEATCEAYGIDMLYAAPGTPTDKGHVERAFGTVKGFVEHIATFTGGAPGHRGDIEDRPIFDLVSLDAAFGEWRTRVYQNTPNDGLFDPYRPGVTLTPNQMYMATWDLAPMQPVPMDKIDYIGLLQPDRRTIQAQGMQVNKRFYDSIQLQALRSASPRMDESGNAINDWEIRVHPHDPRAIWVRTPGNEWLEVPWRHRSAVNQPHQSQLWNEAQRIRDAYPTKFSPLERRLATIDILTEANKSDATIRKIRAQQKAAKTMAEIGGVPMPEPTALELEPARSMEQEPAELDQIDNDLEPYTGGNWK
ncbi:DDE-type integrase/transposase/recombinase [Leifsonia naganoensis]|uniref:Transposase InsO family protein n=1 Tax=Leifsonia naganoensis TaxID=150025 RepID=A0A853DRT5_9MICO|nr:DDE-type integrase/transposase/recombinase [Leifsonia naganoensis]NYK09071.1 transposase InsO family protein [Leifsonia naganoensis]